MFEPQNTHHTKLKGDIAAAVVIADLSKKGYYVSTPLSENSPYDLICDTGQLLKIQVKYRASGEIPKNNVWNDKNGSHKVSIDLNKFDFFAIVNDDFTKIAYCPSSMTGKNIAFDYPNSYAGYYLWSDFKEFNFSIPEKRRAKGDPERELQIRKHHIETSDSNNRKDTHKIFWPSDEEMLDLLWTLPTTSIAQKLGVSDSAIWKRCSMRQLSKPPRGYWTKMSTNKNTPTSN